MTEIYFFLLFYFIKHTHLHHFFRFSFWFVFIFFFYLFLVVPLFSCLSFGCFAVHIIMCGKLFGLGISHVLCIVWSLKHWYLNTFTRCRGNNGLTPFLLCEKENEKKKRRDKNYIHFTPTMGAKQSILFVTSSFCSCTILWPYQLIPHSLYFLQPGLSSVDFVFWTATDYSLRSMKLRFKLGWWNAYESHTHTMTMYVWRKPLGCSFEFTTEWKSKKKTGQKPLQILICLSFYWRPSNIAWCSWCLKNEK